MVVFNGPGHRWFEELLGMLSAQEAQRKLAAKAQKENREQKKRPRANQEKERRLKKRSRH